MPWIEKTIFFTFFISFEATVSQPIQSALEELKQHEPKKTNSASVPQKNKKPQTNVQRLIEKWSVPPLVEQRHFHCQENCKHCQENIFYGEEVSAPHITKKLNRLGSVDWNTVGSKSSDNKQWNLFVWSMNRNSDMKFCLFNSCINLLNIPLMPYIKNK